MYSRLFLISLMTLAASMISAQNKIKLTVGDNSMTATLADNEATRTLLSMLADGELTINMQDYGGFEKVGALPQPLPASDTQITTDAGDIMLYQGYNMVIFYGSNSWRYTRLGRIDGATADNLREFLGNGNISLTVSLDRSAGIDEIYVGESDAVYDLTGNPVASRPLSAGLYIINGKKRLIKP